MTFADIVNIGRFLFNMFLTYLILQISVASVIKVGCSVFVEKSGLNHVVGVS